jgi:hypothetical protein
MCDVLGKVVLSSGRTLQLYARDDDTLYYNDGGARKTLRRNQKTIGHIPRRDPKPKELVKKKIGHGGMTRM